VRGRGLALLAGACALMLPGTAFAHAGLESSSPTHEQRLDTSPTVVQIAFDQTVALVPDALRVLDAGGRSLAGEPSIGEGGKTIVARVPHLPRGGYTVRWQALGRDGHVVAGVFTFGIRQRAPEATAAFGASGPSGAENAARWLAFASLALVIGGLGFRLLVLRGTALPRRFERRFYLITLAGAIGVVEVALVAFLLRAESVLQLPLGTFLYGDLRPIAGTPFGTAWVALTLAFVLVIALIFLAWLTERRSLLWPAFAIAVAFASSYSLSGHSAAEPNASRWSQLADWIHLTAASLWAGGLVMLLVVCLTTRKLGRQAFAGFARLAPVLIALLVTAGAYLSFLRLPEPAALWTTSYGQVLMVKLGLVALALTWGAVHHFVVKPRLDHPGVVARLPRSLAGEAAVGMAILIFAAILTDTAPPRSQESANSLNDVPVGSAACARRPHGVSLASCVTLPPSSTIRSRAASVSSTPK
jgi:copper transport protein